MYQYKGFAIEPVIGGWNIVLYGHKHTLYVSGPSGMNFTDNMKEARSFRGADFCERLIDEMIRDYVDWIGSIDTKPIHDLSSNVQHQNESSEHIQQQQQLPSL